MLPFNVRVDLAVLEVPCILKVDTCSLKGTFTIQVSEVESKRQVKEIDLATHSGKQVAWLVGIR